METISAIVEKSKVGEIEKPVQGLSLGIEYLCPSCNALIAGRITLDEFGKTVVLFECPDPNCGYAWARPYVE
jgi:hypothetical protein